MLLSLLSMHNSTALEFIYSVTEHTLAHLVAGSELGSRLGQYIKKR